MADEEQGRAAGGGTGSGTGGAFADPLDMLIESGRAALAATPMSPSLKARCTEMLDAWARFAAVYAEAAGRASGAAGGGSGAEGGGRGPFDPLAWLDAGAGGGLGDLWALFAGAALPPPLAALRHLVTGAREWANYAAALERFRLELAAGWRRAWERFAREAVASPAGGGATADTFETGAGPDAADGDPGDVGGAPGALFGLWLRVADEELARTMRSPGFLAAQEALIRARLDCMEVLRRAVAEIAVPFGLASAAEVVELATRLHALERAVGHAAPRAGGDARRRGRSRG